MFEEYLKKDNKEELLWVVDYKSPPLQQKKEICRRILEAVNNKESILLISDPDVDGLCSLLILRDMFRKLNTNVSIQEYNTRSHNINKSSLDRIKNKEFDLVIITDTGSSEMDTLKEISEHTDVIVIDHHCTKYDYKDYPLNVICLNNETENKLIGYNKYNYSAGALTFIIADYVLKSKGFGVNNLSTYALTSLYSDCMDMFNSYNREIYFEAINCSLLPNPISQFCSNNTILSRRFLVFRYINKINALFRAEYFSLINKIIMKDLLSYDEIRAIEFILEKSREVVNCAVDVSYIENLGDFTFADISMFDYSSLVNKGINLKNYTGLVANKISSVTGKPTVVVCGDKGSLRDTSNRNLLNDFKKFCDANGHQGAFGFNFKNIDKLKDNIQNLKLEDLKDNCKNYILDINSLTLDDVADMAFFNEFNSLSNPQAMIRLNTEGLTFKRGKYYNSYRYKDFTIKSRRVIRDNEIIVKPEISNSIYLYYM